MDTAHGVGREVVRTLNVVRGSGRVLRPVEQRRRTAADVNYVTNLLTVYVVRPVSISRNSRSGNFFPGNANNFRDPENSGPVNILSYKFHHSEIYIHPKLSNA